MKKILILDAHTTQGLATAEDCAIRGISTDGVFGDKCSYGYGSKYFNHKYFAKIDQDDYEKFVISLLSKKNYDLILSMTDETSYFLAAKKVDISNYTKVHTPNLKTFELGYNKAALMSVCKSIGVPCPETVLMSSKITENDLKSFVFPAILKPDITSGARGFKIVKSASEAIFNYKILVKEFGSYHLQEYLAHEVEQFKAQILRIDGRVLACSVLHKHRYYPLSGGSSTYNTMVENEEIVNNCKRVLEELSWEGFADFDLLMNRGVPYIIEINPRYPASIRGVFKSGLSYSLLQLEGYEGKELRPTEYLSLRFLSLDILWLVTSGLSRKSLAAFLKHFHKDYFQDFILSDPMSFFYGTIGSLKKLTNSNFVRKKSL